MIEYKHPDCKTVFAVGQVWENGYGVLEEITEICYGHSFPIGTTGGRYTKDGHWHDKCETDSDLKTLLREPETTPIYTHPDSGIVFAVGQNWYDNFCKAYVTITEINHDAIKPIKTTGFPYTKTGRIFEIGSTVGLQRLVSDTEPTKIKRMTKAPKYTHKNGTVFKVGQDWLTENNKIVKILQITNMVHGYDYPIKTTVGDHTKDGNWLVEGQARYDLKELCEEPEITKETP
jgi:hypothetical protein